MWVKNGSEKQQHQQPIDNIREGVIESVVQHDEDKAKHNAGANPYYLHT
jgi:hypothetical protein